MTQSRFCLADKWNRTISVSAGLGSALKDCRNSGPGYFSPFPARPTCEGPVSISENSPKPSASMLAFYKQDLTRSLVPMVSCVVVRQFFRCTEYFFGSEQTTSWNEFQSADVNLCQSYSKTRNGVHGELSIEDEGGISKTKIDSSYPCSWTGTSTRSSDQLIMKSGQLSIDPLSKVLIGPYAGLDKCGYQSGNCTSGNTVIIWNTTNRVFSSCGFIVSLMTPCIYKQSKIEGSHEFVCKRDHMIINFESDPKPVMNCMLENPMTSQTALSTVYRSVDGYLISLMQSTDQTVKILFENTVLRETGTPSSSVSLLIPEKIDLKPKREAKGIPEKSEKPLGSHQVESQESPSLENSNLKAHLTWSYNDLSEKTTAQLNTMNYEICLEYQKSWDILWGIRVSNPEYLLSALTKDPDVTGYTTGGMIYSWRCDPIYSYRVLDQKTTGKCHRYWPVEYLISGNLTIEFVEPMTMRVHRRSPKVDCNFLKHFLIAWNETHWRDVRQNEAWFAKSKFWTAPHVDSSSVVFDTPSMYRASEISGVENLEEVSSILSARIDQLEQAITGNTPISESTSMKINGDHFSKEFGGLFAGVFGSLGGKLVEILLSAVTIIGLIGGMYGLCSWFYKRNCGSKFSSLGSYQMAYRGRRS